VQPPAADGLQTPAASSIAESRATSPMPTSEGDDLGLEVLTQLPDTETDPFQIIFLHGLGGSKSETWRFRGSKDRWPQWLASENGLESVRIALFGYDANYKFSRPNSNLNINIFATDLLLALNQLHFNTRPVLTLFVGVC
jgi:pimeloyl-ACP methyl ester carboxylesterase